MMVNNKRSVFGLLYWQGRNVALYTTAALVVVMTYELLLPFLSELPGWKEKLEPLMILWKLPLGPVAVLGGAIGIFASFRTNSAYDRWWEGRKLWGRMINSSRMWCTQALVYVDDTEVAHRLVMRHVAYVHALRCLLRKQDPLADAELLAALPEEPEQVTHESNLTHALLHLQAQDLRVQLNADQVSDMQLHSMDETIAKLLDIQGGCERIKGTPLPRGYGFIVEMLIEFFSVLLPFALVAQMGWFTIPMSVLICLGFTLISEAGRVLEDPFNLYWNALPLHALSRKIEVNLRQRLGHTDLPPMLTPDEKGILM
ncbi:MAG: bestrophin family ion channel [Myxococcota bacterium]